MRMRRLLPPVAVAATVAAVTGSVLVASRGHEDITLAVASSAVPSSAASSAPTAGPTPGAPLTAHVTGPTTITVGSPATWVLHWRDGAGARDGDVEQFGDNVGLGALRVTRCAPGDHTGDGPADGTLTFRHTYMAPGRYSVRLGIDTIGCHAPQEEAVDNFTVTVTAP